MEDWKAKLKGVGTKLRQEEDPFREDPIDVILRLTLGPTYDPKPDELVGRVIRNHYSPFLVRTLDGKRVFAYSEGRQNPIEVGDFVGIRLTGQSPGKNQRVYHTATIKRVYGE